MVTMEKAAEPYGAWQVLREEAPLERTQLTKRLRMLEFLHRAYDESRDRGDPTLMLEFYNPPPHDDLESYNTLPYEDPPRLTVFGTRVDVAQELGIGGTEAINLFKDLDTEEYILLDYGSGGPYIDAGTVSVSFTEKGHTAIEVLHNPNETLLGRLGAIAEAIRGLQGVHPDEKQPAIEAVEELRDFIRALPPETTIELLGRLPSVLGLGRG
jgi:hypothetical protein